MGTLNTVTISSVKYRNLVAKAMPKVIETRQELRRFTDMLEALDRPDRNLSPEERALEGLLERLLADYEDRIELPEVPPHEMLAHLMEHRGLRQADMLPVFGSRSVASAVLSGKREPSKAHIRRLADFFKLSPAAFF